MEVTVLCYLAFGEGCALESKLRTLLVELEKFAKRIAT